MKTREFIADWLKGVAITLMVYGHISHLGALATIQKQIVAYIYTFHMALFLIISGFFFKISDDSYPKLKKLISRIARPYIIFISLYLCGLWLIERIGIPTNNTAPQSFLDFLDIIFLKPKGAYWFLHSLLLIQASLLLASCLQLKYKLPVSHYIIIALFFIAILWHYQLFIAETVVYFLIGMQLRSFTGTEGNILPASLKACGLMLVLVWIGNAQLFAFNLVQVAWVLSIMSFLAALGNIIKRTPVFLAFTWLGRNSLIILVAHALFVVALKPLAGYLLIIDSTGVGYSCLVLSMTLVGCLLSAFLLDKLALSVYLFGTTTLYSPFKIQP